MMNFKMLIMILQSEMALCIKTFNRSIHPNSSSLRMRPMKTYCTSTISAMGVETSLFGAHASSAPFAKKLIFVKHASIRDCADLTLKKEK